jgi:hypothetical protein
MQSFFQQFGSSQAGVKYGCGGTLTQVPEDRFERADCHLCKERLVTEESFFPSFGA